MKKGREDEEGDCAVLHRKMGEKTKRGSRVELILADMMRNSVQSKILCKHKR